MPESAVESVGPFRIERELGRGGMGVVYLARDTRLDRLVAIKALPAHLADDPDRLARFQREAKVLASLNHPNIAALHGLEVVDQVHYLILEYVEGETLANRLERGPMAVEDARELAVQIAEALEAAHDKGIVHRDLKPGNVMVTSAGVAKVLDFGLARTADGNASSSTDFGSQALSQAVTSPAPMHSPTIPGAIMGTAGYMSPEQARGKPVDKRSDIFSFGCVLYEMLTGDQPFRGETASDSIGATLHKEFDRSQLPPEAPASMARVLGRCLAKDRRSRLHDIADARIELQAVEPEAALAVTPGGPSRGVVALALLAIAIVAAGAAWLLKPAAVTAPIPVLDAEIVLPEGDLLGHRFGPGIAISRDGAQLAFPIHTEPGLESSGAIGNWVGSRGLVNRRLGEARIIPLAGTQENSSQPAFSPDGQWIAYVASGNEIFKIPVAGGQPVRLGEGLPNSPVVGLAWGDDGFLLIGQHLGGGLLRLSSAGGTATPYTTLNDDTGESGHFLPHILPDGRGALLTVCTGSWASFQRTTAVWVHDAATSQRRLLVDDASHAQYADGQIIFVREGALMAARFDLDRLELVGEPRPLPMGVAHSQHTLSLGTRTFAAQFALARDGTLAFAEGSVFPELKNSLVWVDRAGAETPVGLEPRHINSARLSPDATKIALWAAYVPARAIWVHELSRGITRRIASGASSWAAWGPEPHQLTFRRTGVDGKEQIGVLTPGAAESEFAPIESDGQLFPAEWTPDGKWLLGAGVADGSAALFLHERETGWEALQKNSQSQELWPAISPDGRWLAFASNESGIMEVYVRPLHEAGASHQISIGGGGSSAWSRDGKELFYRGRRPPGGGSVGDIFAVSIEQADGRLTIGKPERLFPDKLVYGFTGPIRAWDVAPDGRFLFIKTQTDEELRATWRTVFPDRIRVIQNWVSSLEP